MSKSSLKSAPAPEAPRKPRADAQRNRLHILQIAREAFTRSGADVSMDEVAKLAGVGPGTLYRHFPNRDALIEAVYLTELEKLATAEKDLAATLPPIEALRAWMLLFIDYMTTKQIIHSALNAMVAEGSDVFKCSMSVIQGGMDRLAAAAVASGDLRPNVEPMDLLRALFGFTQFQGEEWQKKSRTMVDILLLGSRP